MARSMLNHQIRCNYLRTGFLLPFLFGFVVVVVVVVVVVAQLGFLQGITSPYRPTFANLYGKFTSVVHFSL